MPDLGVELQQQVRQAAAEGTALRLVGGDSKAFYGNPVQGERLDLSGHSGILSYEPSELVLTARGGTSLQEIEEQLEQHGQHLSFEPPHYNGQATLGGTVASGLAGPARPWGGAPRDVLLGVRLLDGKGRDMRFGGQVMKNVAGYDIARLMAGAQGTLGVLLELSLKVLPKPVTHITLVLEADRTKALARMRELCRLPIPLSGACHLDGRMYLRLSGSEASIKVWQQRIGGEPLAPNSTFWQRLRDHELEFFESTETLWRLSLPAATPPLGCEHHSLLDWAGGQRWLYSSSPAEEIRAEVAHTGGHAECFRRSQGTSAPFQTLSPGLLNLQRRLKQRFDPHHILNPGRLFDDWITENPARR